MRRGDRPDAAREVRLAAYRHIDTAGNPALLDKEFDAPGFEHVQERQDCLEFWVRPTLLDRLKDTQSDPCRRGELAL